MQRIRRFAANAVTAMMGLVTEEGGPLADAKEQLPVPPLPADFLGRTEELGRFIDAMRRVRLALVYGIGGVGKTSFALCAGQKLAQQSGGVVVYHSCRPGDGLASVVSRIVGGSDGDPIDRLMRAAREGPRIVVLDDAHRLTDGGLVEAVTYLAARSLPLWFCFCSRADLRVSPLLVDHVVVRLSGLGHREARALWDALEVLYGSPRVDYDRVAARCGGNPFLLKHAFGSPDVRSTASLLGLDELTSDARAALTSLAAYRRPVPATALPEGALEEIERLTRRFLVERDRNGTYLLHDLVREAMTAATLAPEPAHHAHCLAYYRAAGGGSPPARDALEVLHHAVAAGEVETARQILEDHAARVRYVFPMASGEEHEIIDAIDGLARRGPVPPAIGLLRARLSGRRGEAERAYEEIQRIGARRDVSVDLDEGELAYALGHLDVARANLERCAEDERASLPARIVAVFLCGNVCRDLRAFSAARRLLARAEPIFAAMGPLGDGLCWALRGALEYEREQFGLAADHLAAARASRGVDDVIRMPLVAVLDYAARCAAGRTTEAPLVGECFDASLLMRLASRLLYADALLWQGRATEAARILEQCLFDATRTRCKSFEWWATWLSAETDLVVGRTTIGLSRLEIASEEAAAARCRSALLRMEVARVRALLSRGKLSDVESLAPGTLRRVRDAPGASARVRAAYALSAVLAGRNDVALERLGRRPAGRGFHALEWELTSIELSLWARRPSEAAARARSALDSAERAGWRLLSCRARLLVAEVALLEGDFDRALLYAEEAQRDATSEQFAQPGVMALLLRAAIARCRGRADHAWSLLTEAGGWARAYGLAVEADAAACAEQPRRAPGAPSPGRRLALRLTLASPISFRLRLASEAIMLTREQVDHLVEERFDVVVNAATGRVKIGERRADLARHPVLLAMVGALAAALGQPVATDALFASVWGGEYHPVRHHGRVTMAVARLRQLFGEHIFVGVAGGYALTLPGARAVAIVERLEDAEA